MVLHKSEPLEIIVAVGDVLQKMNRLAFEDP